MSKNCSINYEKNGRDYGGKREAGRGRLAVKVQPGKKLSTP